MMMWENVWIPSIIIGSILLLRRKFKKPNSSWINGRCVLITGAGSGLGLSLALHFNRLGAKVILCGRNVERLKEAQESFSRKDVTSWVFKLDLNDLTSIEETVLRIADEIQTPVHILINNAGQSYRGMVEKTQMSVHQQLMNVNYLGHVALSMAWLKYLRDSTKTDGIKDWVVYVSSVQGRVSLPYRSSYCAPKHAIQAFADTLRAEQAATKNGVRVLVASPGYIRTNLSMNAVRDSGETHGQMDTTTARGMSADEVAKIIVDALCDGKNELIIAPALHRFIIVLRAIFPSLYFWIMKLQARKEPY